MPQVGVGDSVRQDTDSRLLSAYTGAMKNLSLLERLNFALNGLKLAWISEQSFRTQVGCGVLAFAMCAALRPGFGWLAILVVVVGLVLAAELINSALEALVDHLHPEIHPEIKKVKDMAAGAVLVLSVIAVIVGLLMVISNLLK